MTRRMLRPVHSERQPRSCRWLFLFAVLVVVWPAQADVVPLCVQVERNGTTWRDIRSAFGRKMRLSFSHSLYGSRVEEVFHLLPLGFQLVELRYGEQRLADFYSHQNTRYENRQWIVKPTPVLFPSLNLHAGVDSSMSLLFDERPAPVALVVPADSAVRLTITACKNDRDG
jgi:hypothetical protein